MNGIWRRWRQRRADRRILRLERRYRKVGNRLDRVGTTSLGGWSHRSGLDGGNSN
jgi:hypothetical protein